MFSLMLYRCPFYFVGQILVYYGAILTAHFSAKPFDAKGHLNKRYPNIVTLYIFSHIYHPFRLWHNHSPINYSLFI